MVTVYTKAPTSDVTGTLSLVDVLPSGQTAASVVLTSVYPTGSTLDVTPSVATPSSLSILFEDGEDFTTFGITLTVTSNTAATYAVQLVLNVTSNATPAMPSVDAMSFADLVDELIAGESAVGKASFMLPPGFDTTGASVAWTLLDRGGVVHASSNAYDLDVISDTFSTRVEAYGLISAPSAMPPSSEGYSYQIRWELTLSGNAVPTYAFESIRILGLSSVPVGTESSVELVDDPINVGIVLPALYTNVQGEIFDSGNTRLLATNETTITGPTQVSGGWYYGTVIDPVSYPNVFPATFDPYVFTWKYWNSSTPNSISRQTAQVYIINPSILSATEDIRRMLMKAKTTMFGMQDMLFDIPTMMTWLRRARDMFNAAAGFLTEFTMLNATGGIREFWLRYAEVAMLQAQALAEGEKAFNFAGQAISLDVDKSQYYQTLADSLLSQINQDISPFKQNLLKKGATGGDGNMAGVAAGGFGASSKLGISIHPASQYSTRRLRY